MVRRERAEGLKEILPAALISRHTLRVHNPYQTSASTDYQVPQGYVSPMTYQALAGTKPWVRLCSVMGFIAAGFMILAGLAMLIGGAAISSRSSAAAFPAVMGIVYIVLSILYLFPAIKLWKYGSAIVRLMSTKSTADLDQAMIEQKGFWQFVGILMLIMVVIMGLSMLIGIFGAVAAAS